MNSVFEGKRCRIIEVAHGLNKRNVFISLDDLPKWVKNQLNVDLYSSFFRYYTNDPNIGGILAGFGMDFDDAEKPKRAQKEALLVAKNLMDRFDIKEKDISINFSGNKGFHMFVNHAVLGIEPHYYFPQIFKEMAKELIREHGLKTLDPKIYDRRRLIRLPNTRHQKSGLYKIPLTFSELETLSIDKIKALATKPRPLFPQIEHKTSKKAARWFQHHRDAFMKKLEERRVEFTDADFQIEAILPCVKKRLELGAPEGMRNRYTWQLASYFCKKGVSLDECLKFLRIWYEKLEKGLERYTWRECEQTIRKTYEFGGYGIGCGSEYVEGLCVGKENCPLFGAKQEETEFSEEIMEKAEKILEKSPLNYVTDTVNTVHVGDRELIKISYISGLSAQLAKAINLWPIGRSQIGKTHGLHVAIHLFPKEHYETFTSASPKSLFYYAKKYGEECFNGKLVFIDEVESSKLTLPMLRSLTSPVDIQPRHLSVYDAELLDLKIKGPRVIWFTSVKAFGADQLRNRFVFVNPDETEKQDKKVFELQKEQDEFLKLDELEEFKIAQALTKKILEETKNLKVEIPYINRINWPYKQKRWLFPIFKNFVKIIAKIYYKQRKHNEEYIVSMEKDFEITKKLWTKFLKAIIQRASESASKLLKSLPTARADAQTKAELAEKLGYSTQYIGRLMNELDEAGLVNEAKRGNSKEYWKSMFPGAEEIKLIRHEPHEHDSRRVKKIFKKNKNAKTNIHGSSSSSHYPTCCLCHNPISNLKNLSNVDGEPAHKKCVEDFERGRK